MSKKISETFLSALDFFKKNAVIICAAIIGLIIIFPSVYFHYFDKSYHGIEYFGSDGEELYLAQVQEMYDGHYAMGNIYLADGKNNPYVLQPLIPFTIMVLGRMVGASAPIINILTKFLFPFLLFPVIYYFFKLLLKQNSLALLVTVFVMLSPATTLTFLNPSAWLPFFRHGTFVGADLQFLSYARPINPQFSSFFFFGYLICLWKFIFEQNKKYGYFSVILLGLSFYSYFFVFSLLFSINGFLGLWFLVKKDWQNLKKIALITGGGLLVGVPYFVNTIHLFHSPLYPDVAHRLGVAEGRNFIFSRVWWGVLLAVLFLYRKWDDFKVFILAFLAATFFVTNQQLLTSRTVPIPSHYHWYFIAPIGGGILLYIIFIYLKKYFSGRVFNSIFVLTFLLFIWFGVQFQIKSYQSQRDIFVGKQRYAPVVSWLKNNLPKDSTVYGNSELSQLIPAYTNKNVYYHKEVGDYLVSDERIRHTLFVYLYLNGVTKDSVRNFIENNREDVSAWLFSQKYRVQNGCYACFPDSIVDNLVSQYQDFLKQDFVKELEKYPIDYVAWDKEKDSSWQMDRFFKEIVFQQGPILVYKVK